MRKAQHFWQDLSIILPSIWPNLTWFAALMAGGAGLLKLSGAYPHAAWPGLFLNAFHMVILERVAQESDGLMPILLSFVLPLAGVIILGEGALRVLSVYLQKGEHREEWDTMAAKTYSNHIVVCGIGELGRALVRRLHVDHPEARIVLVDLRSGLLAETGILEDDITCIQSDMTSTETLKKANCQKARLVLLASGNDAFNLEAAYKVVQLNPQAETWVRLHHSGLADLMGLSSQPNLHFFSPYQQAADAIAGHLLNTQKTDK